MKRKTLVMIAAVAACASIVAKPTEIQANLSLGTAADFAVLGGSTVTNTGETTLVGNLGVHPGTAISGFFGTVENEGPGTFTGTVHQGDAVAEGAQADARAAYTDIAGRAADQNLTDQDLGGLTLAPGVYSFNSSAELTGALTLAGEGDYFFQIGSALTSASGSSITLAGGADAFQVYWQVGTSATLGTGTVFAGTIIADQSVTLDTGASLKGRAIGLEGAVTLDNNNVIPEPATLLLALGGMAVIYWRRRMA